MKSTDKKLTQNTPVMPAPDVALRENGRDEEESSYEAVTPKGCRASRVQHSRLRLLLGTTAPLPVLEERPLRSSSYGHRQHLGGGERWLPRYSAEPAAKQDFDGWNLRSCGRKERLSQRGPR